MKNLLIYTGRNKKFDEEHSTLVKIQIDNSLDLGWKKIDILLFTNFRFEYNGVKSIIVPDQLQCKFDKTSNKILVIDYLLNKEALEDKLYWYHDFDVYQNYPIKLVLVCDLGLTPYGYKAQWNGGSFFFKVTAYDIFQLWRERMLHRNRTRADEKTMTDLTLHRDELDKSRYVGLNITYNFGMRHIQHNYKHAEKPLKALHFHPEYNDILLPNSTKEIFMYGKNNLKIPLMSDRLIKIFHHHGIK